jgi:hypothetical protein
LAYYIANTKNLFINMVDTERQGERVKAAGNSK